MGTRRKFSSESSSELSFDKLFNSNGNRKPSNFRGNQNFADAKNDRKKLDKRKHSQRPQTLNIDRNINLK